MKAKTVKMSGVGGIHLVNEDLEAAAEIFTNSAMETALTKSPELKVKVTELRDQGYEVATFLVMGQIRERLMEAAPVVKDIVRSAREKRVIQPVTTLLKQEFAHMAREVIEGLYEREMQNRDPLMKDVFSRRGFELEILENIVANLLYNEPCAVLMLRVDNLEDTNTRLGVNVGDKLLREVGRRVAKEALEHGEKAYRYRSNEISIILPAADMRHTREVAIGIFKAVGKGFQTSNESFPRLDMAMTPQISIGAATLSGNNNDAGNYIDASTLEVDRITMMQVAHDLLDRARASLEMLKNDVSAAPKKLAIDGQKLSYGLNDT